MKGRIISSLVIGAIVAITLVCAPQASAVSVHSSDRYYTDASGNPVFLIGYYDWASVAPGYYIDHPSEYAAMIEDGAAYGLNYIRISLGINRLTDSTNPNSWDDEPTPVAFAYSNGKANLDQWDSTFWDGLRYQVELDEEYGVIVHVAIFDGVEIRYQDGEAYGYQNSFWKPSNQTTSFYPDPDLPANGGNDNGGIDDEDEFYQLSNFTNNTGIGYYQKRLIDKVTTELASYDNVFFEVGNELLSSDSDWNAAVISYIKTKTTKPVTQCGGSQAGNIDGWAQHEADTPADVKSNVASIVGQGWPAWEDPDGPDLSDLNVSPDDLRRAAWYSFAGGAACWGGFTVDFWSEGSGFNTTKAGYYGNLLSFIDLSDISFWNMTPQQSLIGNNSENSCIAASGAEYLGYVLNDSSVTLNLSSMSGGGDCLIHDPRAGTWSNMAHVDGGATWTFYKPGGADDWVVYARKIDWGNEVSIDLGSPDDPSGMTHPHSGDGDTTAADQGGRSCRKNTDANNDYYFYFAVSDSFTYQGSTSELWVTIDYYDTGNSSLTMQYDASGGSYTSAGSVTLTNTNTWKQKTWHVTDAYFGNRQNDAADFRISAPVGLTFYLDIVEVSKVEPGNPVNNAEYVSDTIPSTMTAGQQYQVSVTMRNTGNTTWTEASLYRLGAVGDSDPFADGRQYLASNDAIGYNQTKTWTFTMTAPTSPNTYTTDWRMVQDQVEWFGATLTKQVQVNAATPSTINIKSAANMNLVIDGGSSDWTLGDFTTKTRGGQSEQGDYAIVGYDGGTCYYGDYEFSLPTSASDHTGKVYSRHDQQYQYFLVRCDDEQMNYAQPTSANWANDCIEFYIDPGHDHGPNSIDNSTSDLQFVIDCNNQKNVYMTTSGYATQVLNGVTSAVVRDGTGWWLEVKILKSVLDPDLPASGSFGVDFCFRDNDNPDGTYPYGNPSSSTMYSWRDNTSGTFPSKIPDNWGNASLATLSADTTPPASVTGFSATAGSLQVSLSWTNPGTADWAGTQIRFKTTGYPTGPTDGTQCYNSAGSSYVHTGLTAGVTYYYSAYAYDEVPNYATAAQANATPTAGGSVETINVKSAANLNLVIDGTTSDWSLGDFSTKSRGGQNETGDYAIVGYDSGTCYYGSYVGVLPTSATDHTAKIYSRHDQQFQFLLVRCDDSDMQYGYPTSANWANDCVEFYIDPSHNHGSSSLSDSTSDIQLVIDANNQRNVYCCTSGYASQVLAGVTSTVVRDGTGWWLEVKITKSALDPDMPASGSFGVDFNFRDNDNNNDSGQTTVYAWSEYSTSGYPSKIPDHWGDASLATLSTDTTPPASVTGFSATAGSQQVSLSWTNPGTADWAGTQIRFKTTGYPTGPTDGTQCYNSTGSSYVHTGLTSGVTYYYCAYAYDEVPNYATAAQANATPTSASPQVFSNSTFSSDADGWSIATWKSGSYDPGTIAWNSGAGQSGGGMRCTGSGSTDNYDRCNREGGEIYKTISTSGYAGISVEYDLRVNSLGSDRTGAGDGSCTVDHNIIDEQLTVFYSTNGGSSWTEANYITRSTLLGSYQSYGTRSIDLSSVSACNNNSSFAMRFRWQLNTSSDTADLDNIKVIGTPQ